MSEASNLTVTVRMSSGTRFTIGSSSSPIITKATTIQQIKTIISNEASSGNCPTDRQRLIHKGRILNDDNQTLEQYGILDSSHTLHLVKGSAPRVNNGSTGGTAGATTTPASTASTPASSTNSAPNNNMNNNPFAFPMGMNNNQNMFGGDMSQMQSQLLSNPELMSSLMNSPMMQSLTSNPDFFRSMMESNPQMRQLLDSNPQLRHILDDPELMRQSMEMMRDPNAMQNAMRNQDLAMSQIENLPGGFSALRRMYEDVQEPMMDALANGRNNSSGGDGGNSNNTTRSENANSGAAGTAMPNPWASSATTPGSGATNTATTNNNNNNNNTTNPWANLGAAGMGGMNMNDMSSMMNSMNAMNNGQRPNLEQTIQLLENPMMQQMMNNLTSNPQLMQSMMDSNPMLRQMREQNPQLASMMSNPEVMRQMMNPDNLRGMMQMQNMMESMGMGGTMGGMGGSGTGMNSPFPMFGGLGGAPPTNPSTATGGGSGLDFSTLLTQMQSTNLNPSNPSFGANPSNPIPPEQRFRMQLQSLNDMGFDDNRVNIAALMQTHGNVNRAVDVLLTSPPAPYVDTNASTSAVPAATTPSVPASSSSNVHDQDDGNEDIVDKDKVEKKND